MIADNVVVQLRRPAAAPVAGQFAVIVDDCCRGERHVVDLADVLSDPGNSAVMPCGQRVRVQLAAFPGYPF